MDEGEPVRYARFLFRFVSERVPGGVPRDGLGFSLYVCVRETRREGTLTQTLFEGGRE